MQNRPSGPVSRTLQGQVGHRLAMRIELVGEAELDVGPRSSLLIDEPTE